MAVEPMRSTIQEAFYAILTDLRQQSVLTVEARAVLETIDDYMLCVKLSVAAQLIANDKSLLSAVSDNSTPSGPQYG